jgi:small-conductance mechanosensitive channel
LDQFLSAEFYLERWQQAEAWLSENALALSIATFGQLAIVTAAFFAARALAPRFRQFLAAHRWGRFEAQFARVNLAIAVLVLPIIWLLLLWIALLIATATSLPLQVINLVVSLLAAWVVIRFSANLLRDPLWSRFVTVVAWTIAALNILNLLAPTMALLDGAAVHVGALRISALTVIKAVLLLALLLWLATVLGRMLERRVTSLNSLTPSLRVLVVKLLKIVLTVIAVVAALQSVGIDLTAFAVLTGAIGVGIGFGLQKMVSNFVSGITILLDRSIKPGDVIAVGETYGRVQSLGARYVSIVARDGREFLIPNEDLVTQQVENWTYSSEQIRLKVPIGVSYDSDPRRAIALCVEAAGAVERVLKTPEPACLIRGFGDSAIDLELRFWIGDPTNGVANVKSEVLLQVWDRFQQHGIELPYPQRDFNITAPIEVSLKAQDGAARGDPQSTASASSPLVSPTPRR